MVYYVLLEALVWQMVSFLTNWIPLLGVASKVQSHIGFLAGTLKLEATCCCVRSMWKLPQVFPRTPHKYNGREN